MRLGYGRVAVLVAALAFGMLCGPVSAAPVSAAPVEPGKHVVTFTLDQVTPEPSAQGSGAPLLAAGVLAAAVAFIAPQVSVRRNVLFGQAKACWLSVQVRHTQVLIQRRKGDLRSPNLWLEAAVPRHDPERGYRCVGWSAQLVPRPTI